MILVTHSENQQCSLHTHGCRLRQIVQNVISKVETEPRLCCPEHPVTRKD